ncbi:PREDICTED: uncharacterized protein K02A2.6-like [Trachymyrmex septentrionalis]|nr:PREDICTED: uncharacterized protein K02A2.6-like [Trachymyrmex septentrionalis]
MHISHILSAVNHPQSNGQAERMVDSVVKRATAKNPSNWRKELQDFLYSYRYTPCSATSNGRSSAELMFGRRITSPFTKLLLKLPVPPSTFPNNLTQKQLEMQQQFEHHHGARHITLNLGDRVLVALKDKREQGYIKNILSNTRYLILLDSGRSVERHINHIWIGGSAPANPDSLTSDDWTHYEPEPVQNPAEPRPGIPALPQGNLYPGPAPSETPARPFRHRVQPRRLVLDPKAKSYTQL